MQIRSTWCGEVARPEEWAELELGAQGEDLVVSVTAPWHGDPSPPGPPGSHPGLWEFEVVELFVAGAGDRYLELEFGPHGHYLALGFEGERRLLRSDLVLEGYRVRRDGPRWRARAVIPATWLPLGLDRANAYAIHGVGAARRHLAMQPIPGAAPDFHRIDRFPAWRPPAGVHPRGEVFRGSG